MAMTLNVHKPARQIRYHIKYLFTLSFQVQDTKNNIYIRMLSSTCLLDSFVWLDISKTTDIHIKTPRYFLCHEKVLNGQTGLFCSALTYKLVDAPNSNVPSDYWA
jgi:hypothetical protein